MKGTVKIFAAAVFVALISGAGFGADTAVEFGTPYIIEDTTRDMVAAMHSRLDAFRKVALPVTVEPAAAETVVVADTAALGSLVLPEYINYGSRYLNRFWGGGIGTWQDADRQSDDYEGYAYKGQGAMLGYDRAFGALTVGIAGSYVKGDYDLADFTRHNSEIKQYSGNVYATYNTSAGFFFSLTGGYTHGDTEIDESDSTDYLLEDFNSRTFNAGLRAGYDFEPTSTIVITPSIGGNFFHTRVSDHNVDAFGTAYRMESVRHNLFEIPVDIQIAKEFDFGKNRSLQISANGGYAYNLTDKAAYGDLFQAGNPVKDRVIAREQGRSTWKAGAGARLKMNQWDIGVKYDFLTRSDFDSHRVMGTVGFSF